MNNVTINFIPCATAVGYHLTWRIAGSGDPYTDGGIFTESPASFSDNSPQGTCYEGFLQSDCTESGESGSVVSDAIPWSTPCEESGVSAYDITLNTPCVSNNAYSTYSIINGNIGDTVKVRVSFIGVLQKILGLATRADLSISAVDGTYSGINSSAEYSDTSPHNFSITADTTITMPGDTEAPVTVMAMLYNSSAASSSVVVSIIEINGSPPPSPIFVNGCRGVTLTIFGLPVTP